MCSAALPLLATALIATDVEAADVIEAECTVFDPGEAFEVNALLFFNPGQKPVAPIADVSHFALVNQSGAKALFFPAPMPLLHVLIVKDHQWKAAGIPRQFEIQFRKIPLMNEGGPVREESAKRSGRNRAARQRQQLGIA
jgi:hypothetical protein